MDKKMVSLRLDEGLLSWATSYAEGRGVSRTELLESALAAFRVECESGVPDLKRRIREREERAVVERPSREDFQRACADRAALFQTLRPPLSVRGVKPKGEK